MNIMRKTYINPKTIIVKTSHQRPIALSTPSAYIDTADAGIAPSDFEVKGNSYTSPHYNVWDDDWSK